MGVGRAGRRRHGERWTSLGGLRRFPRRVFAYGEACEACVWSSRPVSAGMGSDSTQGPCVRRYVHVAPLCRKGKGDCLHSLCREAGGIEVRSEVPPFRPFDGELHGGESTKKTNASFFDSLTAIVKGGMLRQPPLEPFLLSLSLALAFAPACCSGCETPRCCRVLPAEGWR